MGTQSNPRRPLVVLAEAIRPLAASTKRRMARAPGQSVEVPDILDFISHHLLELQRSTDAICDQIDLVAKGCSDAEADRAAGRMEVHVERLLAGHDEIRRANPQGEDSRGWYLIRELYRDVIVQIQNWLDAVIDIVDDPVSGLERRGLSMEGDVNITLNLGVMEPQANSLNRWTARRAAELEGASRVDHVSALGAATFLSLFGNDS